MFFDSPQLSKYPSLNRFDKHLPVPKSYIAVGTLAVFTFVRMPWLTVAYLL